MIQNKTVYLVASGDLRMSANKKCWKAQEEMESALVGAIIKQGWQVIRGHEYDGHKGHGFIDSQKMGIEVFKLLDPEKPLIVAESVWQYSHHVLAGLMTHKGPILTVANWNGQWPGLVGMLNLNGSLTKAGIGYSSLWSKEFQDDFFIRKLEAWLNTATIQHDLSHVQSYSSVEIPDKEENMGKEFARDFRNSKAIMGVFDEGCMGMYNAIIPDELLHPTGIYKERLSQSSLYATMLEVGDDEAEEILEWMLKKGMNFHWGENPETELTKEQTLQQCKMYIAALRLAHEFGCDTIGIQYQQGLKDLVPASDLVEGMLNNTDRPPVFSKEGIELYPSQALPHFNEVDECAGLDSLLTYKLWQKLGMEGENTLHDIRWGEYYEHNGIKDFVWVFLISGAVPPAHLIDGYKGATSERQNPMYFRLGGGTLKGISKPGSIVWSRIYVKDHSLHCDLGTGKVASLPQEETQRRWNLTSPEWPIMHGVLNGVSRDQLMAKHQANHIQVVYATDPDSAAKACRIKAAAFQELGIQVNFCGKLT